MFVKKTFLLLQFFYRQLDGGEQQQEETRVCDMGSATVEDSAPSQNAKESHSVSNNVDEAEEPFPETSAEFSDKVTNGASQEIGGEPPPTSGGKEESAQETPAAEEDDVAMVPEEEETADKKTAGKNKRRRRGRKGSNVGKVHHQV